jgi:ribosomal protein S24E
MAIHFKCVRTTIKSRIYENPSILAIYEHKHLLAEKL